MFSTFRAHVQRGFTLVELLIVVIIMAILAAIVIPQFNSATTDTKEAALDSNLAGVRNAIELYKAQHNTYPGATASSGATTCTGTKGTGAIDTAQATIDHLLLSSDAAGNTCSVADATFKYGPYIRKSMPNDAITGKGSLAAEIVVTKTGAALAPAAATGGWAYDNKSGQFVMNSNATDSKGVAFSTH